MFNAHEGLLPRLYRGLNYGTVCESPVVLNMPLCFNAESYKIRNDPQNTDKL